MSFGIRRCSRSVNQRVFVLSCELRTAVGSVRSRVAESAKQGPLFRPLYIPSEFQRTYLVRFVTTSTSTESREGKKAEGIARACPDDTAVGSTLRVRACHQLGGRDQDAYSCART